MLNLTLVSLCFLLHMCIVYDVSRQETFDNIPSYIDIAKSFNPSTSATLTYITVGHKSDLSHMVSTEMAKSWAENSDYLFIETSVNKKVNCNDVFSEVVKKVYITKYLN